jgi:hypothetical protein
MLGRGIAAALAAFAPAIIPAALRIVEFLTWIDVVQVAST